MIRRFEGCLLWQARHHLEAGRFGFLQPEDLVQETWAVVYRKLDVLEELLDDGRRVTPRLMKYLSTTLLQLHMNHSRREARSKQWKQSPERSSTSTDAIAALPDRAQDVVSRIGQRETVDQVYESISELSDEDRKIVILRGIECAPLAVVGSLLDMKPDTVSKRFHRSVARIRASVPDSVFDDLGGESLADPRRTAAR